MLLSDDERARISAAIETAEQTTSGEIFVVAAQRSSAYRHVPIAWAALAAMLTPGLLALVGVDASRLWPFAGGWVAGHAAGRESVADAAVYGVLLMQIVLFAVVYLIVSVDSVRLAMTPNWVKRDRVHRVAFSQFLSHGIHLTTQRTGVLIYVSVAERRAEIVADEMIYEKAEREVWRRIVSDLTLAMRARRKAQGLEAAIAAAGAALAAHFPPRAGDQNELPNKVVEI